MDAHELAERLEEWQDILKNPGPTYPSKMDIMVEIGFVILEHGQLIIDALKAASKAEAKD